MSGGDVQYTTRASEAPCRQCRSGLLYAWDDGRLVRADAKPLDEGVAAALRGAGYVVFALTYGRNLVHETPERHGHLRLVLSRHSAHVCRQQQCAPRVQKQLELFDHESVRPPGAPR